MGEAEQTRVSNPNWQWLAVMRTGASRVPMLVWQVGFGVAILASWQLLSGPVLDPFFVSDPVAVWGYLVEYASGGILLTDLAITLQAAGLGFVLGTVSGLMSGVVLGRSKFLSEVLNPYILAAYGIPRIALAPLFIVWFGIGIESKVMMSGLYAFFLVFFNTYSGVRQVPMEFVNVARVLGAGRIPVVLKVVVPNASPWIMAGLRIAVPYAIVAAIVGEFIAATEGLGYRIVLNAQQFNTTGTLGGVIVVMSVVLVVNIFVNWIERYVMRWQPGQVEGV